MKISGTAVVDAARAEVWAALNDPAVLVRTIPGCQRLDSAGPDRYRMAISAGVASIKGVYEGEVGLSDQQPPDTFVLHASGAGTPGTVTARVLLSLAESGERSTTVTYDADATIGGMIGGVGQRMLTGVAKKTAGEFFEAVADVLNGRTSDLAGPVPGDTPPTPAMSASDAQSWLAPGRPTPDHPGFAPGVALGAAAALVGAVVGGLLARRRQSP